MFNLPFLEKAGFSPNVLLNSFDEKTLRRGQSYFSDGNVRHFTITSNKTLIILYGSVKGTARRPYNCLVQFEKQDPNLIIGSCTCPVRSNCKHCVAVLIAYLNEKFHSSENVNVITEWMNNLNETFVPKPPPSCTTERPKADLIYAIHINDTSAHELQLQPYKTTRLKKGGYGVLSSITLDNMRKYGYGEKFFYYGERDILIAQLIFAMVMDRYYYTSFTLSGLIGRMIFDQALSTGRTYWTTHKSWDGATARPLTWSDTPREARIRWIKRAGSYRIALESDPPLHDYFWLNDRLFYVCTQSHTCGELTHEPFTPEQLRRLLDAPHIPHEAAPAISERLAELLPFPQVPTPTPVERTPIEEIRTAPRPDLLLHAVTYPESGQTDHVCSLRFNYGGHVLQPDQIRNTTLISGDAVRYLIHHQTDAEQDAVTTLKGYGFQAPPHGSSMLKPLDFVIRADNTAFSIFMWNRFLETGVDELRGRGWDISIADNFAIRFHEVEGLQAEWKESGKGNDWFELSLGFEIEGRIVNLLPIISDMLAERRDPRDLLKSLREEEHILVPIDKGRWAKLETKRIATILENLVELYDREALNKDGSLLLGRTQGTNLAGLLEDPGISWKGAEELQRLARQIRDFSGISPVPPPKGLNAKLRPYQQEGLSWLQFLREFQFGGILADDMGLGKTIQTLAHLLQEKRTGRLDLPSLVIVPRSLLGNWRREAERFTPELKVLVIHGPHRGAAFMDICNHDLVITSYALIRRDIALYSDLEFHYVILDEAQFIKNAAAQTTLAIQGLNARHRLCLTGTPLENHLGELWSIFHFLMPGFLGTHDGFSRLFRTPIEKNGDLDRLTGLKKRLAPFMLRRTKDLVEKDLPEKTEMVRMATLEGRQRELYETVRIAMDKKIRDEIAKKGLARSHITILDALLKLRQVCCDPRLLKLDGARNVKQSAKLELLMDLLPGLVAEGRKVILFSQFTSMLALIEEELARRGITWSKLTGQTLKRDEAVAAFQEGEAQVFLVSLKAGGTGLNLTAADTVIHYDPWWNPAVERQATDRAHRIGQDKPVFVYKLLAENTVEEKILMLQQKKMALAEGICGRQDGETSPRFSAEDLLDLLGTGPA